MLFLPHWRRNTGAVQVSAGTWVTSYTQAFAVDSTGWNGFNLRQHIAAALMTQSGSQVRLTLVAATGTSGLSIDGIYLGHAAGSGDAYDFDGTQVQVAVSGSASFTIAQGGSVVTDPVAYALDETKAFIVAAHFDALSTLRGANAVSSATAYFKSAANETATSDVSTYSNTPSALRLVTLIEVLQ